MQFIADARQIDPDKPFYLHLRFGAAHAPHHVAKEWADRYAGQFDDGWDAYWEKVFAAQKDLGIVPPGTELSRHDPDVPDWESLPGPSRRLFSRMMEVFAGFLSHTDHHLGRLLDFLRERGDLDNTIVMVISDNGASAEGGATGTTNEAQFFNNAPESLEDSLARIDEIGGPTTFNHYPWGWTWAGNMVPTVLDMLGIEPPATIRGVTQSPLQGVSFATSFDDAAAASDHHTQYFEMLGNRAIYHDGWRAVCPWPGPSFAEAGIGFGQPISADTLTELDATAWELYHVDEDFAENRDVAAEDRARLIALIGTWYVEAGRYGVMPVDGSGLQRMVAEKPQAAAPRNRYTFIPGTQSMPFFAGPRVLNRPHSITATVEIPEGGAEGVLLSQGSAAGGYTFYLKGGALHYAHNYVSRSLHVVSSPEPVPAGAHELRFEFEPTGEPDLPKGRGAPGRLQLYVDGALVAEGQAPVTIPFVINPGALTCGANPGSPVTPDYASPFPFTGTLREVTVDVSGDLIHDSESEMRMAMARQ
jgi:hypothetical protein